MNDAFFQKIKRSKSPKLVETVEMKLLHSIFLGLAAAQFSSLLEFSSQKPIEQDYAGERKKNKPTDIPPAGAAVDDNKVN